MQPLTLQGWLATLEPKDWIDVFLTVGLLGATVATSIAAAKQASTSRRLMALEDERGRRHLDMTLVQVHYRDGNEHSTDWLELLVSNPTGNNCILTTLHHQQWVSDQGSIGSGGMLGGVWVEGESNIVGGPAIPFQRRLKTVDNLLVPPGEHRTIFAQVSVRNDVARTGVLVSLDGPHLERTLDWWYIEHPFVHEAHLNESPMPDLPDPLKEEQQMDTWRRMGLDERRWHRREGEPVPSDRRLENWRPTPVEWFLERD